MSGRFSNNQRSFKQRNQELGIYLTRAQALNKNFVCQTVASLNDLFKKEDAVIDETTLEEKVENPEEVIIDSKIMTCTSKILEQCTVSLSKVMNTYNSDEYADMIHDYINRLSYTISDETEDINWRSLETVVEKLFKKTPHFSTLSGALEPLPRKKIEKRAPNKRSARAATKRPEKVVATEKEDISVVQTVEKIRKQIIRHYKEYQTALDYFRLVLHPKDFGLTIENILHVSFLVRDGIVQLKQDDSTGALMIIPCTKDVIAQAKQSGKSGSIQNILSIDQNQWQFLINHYEISEPMINCTSGGQ